MYTEQQYAYVEIIRKYFVTGVPQQIIQIDLFLKKGKISNLVPFTCRKNISHGHKFLARFHKYTYTFNVAPFLLSHHVR